MKLIAFRIKNFRSIRDSDWQKLAYDNITCLIGQNESGKTSVLEGLRAFSDGKLVEDMLRSDLTLPEVSCRFSFDYSAIEGQLDTRRIHTELGKKLSSLETITITRSWDQELTSHLETGDELRVIFETEEKKRKEREIKINKLLKSAEDDHAKADAALVKLEKELQGIDKRIEDEKKKLAEIKKSGRSLFAKQSREKKKTDQESIQDSIRKLETDRKKKHEQLKNKKNDLRKLTHKQEIRDKIQQCEKKIHSVKNDIVIQRENI